MNMVNWMMMMKRCLNLQKCDAEHPLSAFSLSLGHSEHGKPSHESVSVSQLNFTVPLQILRAHPSTGKPGDQNAETRGDGKTSCVENCEELRAPRTVSARRRFQPRTQ